MSIRNQQIRKIHTAKRSLGLDEESYRALLQRAGGCVSSADMSDAQRDAVLLEMRRLGFNPLSRERRRWPGEPAESTMEQRPMLTKVRALLADAKRPWSYAHGIASKMFHVERVEFLRDDDLHKLVAAMQVDANRRVGKAAR
ncbi:MAG TPA: regulatory protein GemA [Polyangiaceae bacterium]